MKKCCDCKALKTLDAFGADKSKADGLNARCKECNRARALRYAREVRQTQEGREAHKAASRKWYAKKVATDGGRAALNANSNLRKREWRQGVENREKERARGRERIALLRADPTARERLNRIRAMWDQKHPGRANNKVAKRRAHLGKATPAWADRVELRRIYEACPEGKHVDHEIPLRGKTVCGLHVPGNLRYLDPLENSRKGNRHD